MKEYYNTTNESAEQLEMFESKAKTQSEMIMKFLSSKPSAEYGASRLLSIVFNESIPITSVRRSISNLVKENKLIYTGGTREGLFGRNENLIKFKA
jgi:hypothetical protein|tara:strand:+ start:264 stop:551 length:288 start_codon:yes stop_codon:yes gene_type:complete